MIVQSGFLEAAKVKTDALAIGVFANESDSKGKSKKTKPALNLDKWAKPVDKALGGLLLKEVATQNFTGQSGQSLALHTHGKLPPKK